MLQAAGAHFFHHGFRSVTMDDLAAELGVSKKTLYAHFPGKEALLEAVLREKFARVDDHLGAVQIAGGGNFAVILRAMLETMERELGELQPPFVRDMRLKAPHLFARLEERRARLVETHFGALFRAGQRSGHVRRDLPSHLMIELLLAALHAIVTPPRLAALRLSPREAFADILGIVLHGVLVPAKKGAR